MFAIVVFFAITALVTYVWVDQYRKSLVVKVLPGTVAFDGETVYPSGTIKLPYKYQIVDIEDRITAFGVDVMGLVSIIDTTTSENTWNNEEGYNDKGPFSKSVSGGKSGIQTVSTRQADNFKFRYIITWKPNTERIRQFLKAGNIPERLAELLRTIPDLEMADYADTLGITVIRWDTPKKRKDAGSVDLGDGSEIPY